jgi:streptogramin lyase
MEGTMQRKRILPLSLVGGLGLMPFLAMGDAVRAETTAAITGQVSSEAEGAMEGVVITARKPGAKLSVSVITDAQGRYSFPADRLEPGQYALTMRAVGYDLSGKPTAEVAPAKSATVDLKLTKTKRLASQLTNAEWMMSMPGSDEQKAALLNCTSCHTYERIVRSSHDAEEWTHVAHRMAGYAAVSQPIKPQRVMDPNRAAPPDSFRKLADYLATVNLSSVEIWQYPLKTLPRPKGKATHVIVTEYDLPRPTTEPHDIVVQDGNVWYSDFGENYISKFDPKTLKLTEYPTKEHKPGYPVGNLDLEVGHDGTFWFDQMYQASLGNLDPKTGEIKYYPLAKEFNDFKVQMNFVGLRHDVDGKVWTKNVATGDIFRVDLKSEQWERFQPLKELKNGKHNTIYQVISDSQNNLWMAEFVNGYLGKLDAKTLKVTWYPVPTPNARARRMVIDEHDNILVTEYRGNKVAMFDTRAEKFTEYPMPPYTFPYRAAIDKNGEIWTGGMSTDRVVRYNTKTGQSVEYLMPGETNIRSVFVDNSTSPVTFWTGSNHGAALVKVEPLD